MAVGGGYLFWGDPGTHKIQRSTLEGDAITDIVTAADGLSFPRGLSIVADYIYWTDSALNKIGRARIDGTGVTDILTDVGANYLVAVAPAPAIGVFMTGAGGSGIRYRVERVGLDNKNLERIYDTSDARSGGLCLTDFHVYWADSLQSRIFRANFDGTDVTEVSTVPERPGALAVSDTHIYWSSFDSFNIHRMNFHGGSLEVVQSAEDVYPGDIAVHNGKLHWSESHGFGDGIIRRSNDSEQHRALLSRWIPRRDDRHTPVQFDHRVSHDQWLEGVLDGQPERSRNACVDGVSFFSSWPNHDDPDNVAGLIEDG